ncbi:MAG TPA: membrane protein insertase YidC [bacterium]|nr:membrane protein insertase YidC [bacterium]
MFNVLFYQPIFNALIVLYRAFGGNLGLAIVGIAVLSRLITWPLTNKQLKSADKNKDFKKEYDKVKKKYAKNKEKQSEQLAKLQAKYLPGQLGGCLPIVFQIIFLIQIRRVIVDLFQNGISAFNEVAYPFIAKFAEGVVINPNLFSIDLSKTANDIGIGNLHIVWPYLLLAVSVGVAQLISTLILTGTRKTGEDKQKEEKRKRRKKKKKEEKQPDFSEMMQKSTSQMIYILPVMTIFFSLNFISGISLYWTVQSLFVIIQQSIRERKKLVEWVRLKLSPPI